MIKTRNRIAAGAALFMLCLLVHGPAVGKDNEEQVTFASLLDEMTNMELLARLPGLPFDTRQYSSYDRRSISPDEESWYSNSDGFGREPLPGFEKVLKEPGKDGNGLYQIALVEGPGAVVRTWSARMNGVLRLYLDGEEEPLFEGPAYDFLARRSTLFLERAGVKLDEGDAFCQQDSNYMPLPFASSLRITWEGKIDRLHFYEVEVRTYDEGVKVACFNIEELKAHEGGLKHAVERLTAPEKTKKELLPEDRGLIGPGSRWSWTSSDQPGPGAIARFSVRIKSEDPDAALRGALLRIVFDGAGKPQVDSPLGDFFGSGPGINPYSSTPFSVSEGGVMTCRFVMPYRRKADVSILNSTSEEFRLFASFDLVPWGWDERSCLFHGKWRADNDLDLSSGPFDMPYLVACGKGRFLGVAVMVVNHSGIPTPYGSWWGEGDEKIFVDGCGFPVFFGTGSEDYFNYSWSRPDLFDHPYCGQPLNSGPGNAGYVSNHRWHILDSILFKSSFAFYMELWPHHAYPGLCYDRIAYYYALPGAIDDHRRLQLSELEVRPLIPVEPEPIYGVSGARFFHFEDLLKDSFSDTVRLQKGFPGSSRGRLVTWSAAEKERLSMEIDIEKEGEMAINMVAAHQPEFGALRLLLDGRPLKVSDLGGAGNGVRGEERCDLKSRYAKRILSTGFNKVHLSKGKHTLVLESLSEGSFAFDYIWIR